MSWYVYIAKARTGRYYTGISSNPDLRLKRHNAKIGSRFAVQQGPLKLVYVSSAFESKAEARQREVQVKDWSQSKKNKLVEGRWN